MPQKNTTEDVLEFVEQLPARGGIGAKYICPHCMKPACECPVFQKVRRYIEKGGSPYWPDAEKPP